LGAALFTWHQYLGRERPPRSDGRDRQRASYLGPEFKEDAIRDYLEANRIPYRRLEPAEVPATAARLIADHKVVGWFQGRMEFGPRALGNRSILGDARSEKMQSVMNLKIKFRESFRPFAPSVLIEDTPEYFEMDPGVESPYMLLVANVRPEKRVDGGAERTGLKGMDLLYMKRSVVQAITHVDYSARVQTVDPRRHAPYHGLIRRFKEKTGCPVIINTSFNVRGEPIVGSPEDALNCFLNTGMDALALEHYLLLKTEQPEGLAGDRAKYLKAFKLD
jgi:carbamoyltransferase